MNSLHRLLTRAEENERDAVQQLAMCEKSAVLIKAATAEARLNAQTFHRVCTRLRGVIEAFDQMPESQRQLLSFKDDLAEIEAGGSEAPLVGAEEKPVPSLPESDLPPMESPPDPEPAVEAPAAAPIAELRPPRIKNVQRNMAEPKRSDALPKISASGAIRDRVLAFLTKAQKNGQVLIELAVLAKKVETTELRLDEALTELAETGHLRRKKSGLKGHIALEMLEGAEVGA